ncbi:exported hypothetical protein [Burkholderiales bacterium]|nr:exported hypothetical protein [Burkholderiales bacterium]
MRPKSLPAELAAALVATIALATASCGGGGGSGPPSVRVVNAAYQAPYNFDVLVNTQATSTDLAYLQASVFRSVATGSTTIEFEPTGTTTSAYTNSFPANNGSNYSVLAVEGTGGLTSVVVAQSNSAIPSGQARLTFVGATPGVGTLDFFLSSPTVSLPNTPSLAPVSYAGDASTPAPTPVVVASGNYRIRAIVDGDATRTVVYDSGPLTLAAGADLLLAIIPVSGSAAQFSLLRLDANSGVSQMVDQRVQLRMANFAPGLAGPLDTFLDPAGAANSSATLFTSGLGQNAASAHQAVLPAAYRASFANTGQTTEITGLGSYLALGPGTAVSVMAIGLSNRVAPNNLQLLVLQDNLQAPALGMANLRLVQLAPDMNNANITAVDLVELDASTPPQIVGRLLVNLAYPAASSYVSLPAGTYTVALVPSGVNTPLLPTSGAIALNLSAGTIWTLVVAGCQSPGSGICGSAPAATLQLVPLQDISVSQQ